MRTLTTTALVLALTACYEPLRPRDNILDPKVASPVTMDVQPMMAGTFRVTIQMNGVQADSRVAGTKFTLQRRVRGAVCGPKGECGPPEEVFWATAPFDAMISRDDVLTVLPGGERSLTYELSTQSRVWASKEVALQDDLDGDGDSNDCNDLDESVGACGTAQVCFVGMCVCPDSRQIGANCDQCADPRFAGPSCTTCSSHFAGATCEQCADAFTGPTCATCRDARLTGPDCTQCVDPRFTGELCNQCVDPRFTGSTCEECANPHFTGAACDRCTSVFTGTNCDQCANAKFTGANCDQCAEKFMGEACDECADPRFAGAACDECADPRFTGASCNQCANPRFTGVNCDQCADPRFTGATCTQCSDARFTGASCDQCADPRFMGATCTQCADPHYAGTNCDQCAAGFGGYRCAAPRWADWKMPNASGDGPNTMSYTTTTDVVTDNVTGLMWQRVVSTSVYDATYGAKEYCDALVLGGFSDWRVPSRIELTSLIDYSRSSPSINPTVFPNTPSAGFWTSTAHALSGYQWCVRFDDGYVTRGGPNETIYVRCVR